MPRWMNAEQSKEFRVPIVDSTIFPLFLNKQMEKAENFEPIQPGVYRLSNDGKRKNRRGGV